MGGRDRAALRRIIALLFALAELAEAAGKRSRPVRWLVLSILGAAEPVAWDYVAGLTGLPPSVQSTETPNHPDSGKADGCVAEAMRLAFVFRVLATALAATQAAASRALPDEAAAIASGAIGALAALRDLITAAPFERRDSS